jgi:hypothetical protein
VSRDISSTPVAQHTMSTAASLPTSRSCRLVCAEGWHSHVSNAACAKSNATSNFPPAHVAALLAKPTPGPTATMSSGSPNKSLRIRSREGIAMVPCGRTVRAWQHSGADCRPCISRERRPTGLQRETSDAHLAIRSSCLLMPCRCCAGHCRSLFR